jgi:hypothetical protein
MTCNPGETAMIKHLGLAALLMTSLSACSAGATLARKDSSGGRVQLDGAYMRAMGDARVLMVEHCRGRVDTVELGESIEFRCRVPRKNASAPDLAMADRPAAQRGPSFAGARQPW